MTSHLHRCRGGWLAALLVALVFSSLAAPARAQEKSGDPIFDSAVFLLRSAVTPDRRGTFSILMRSLRHLRDPELQPFFKEMVQSDNRVLKIHGILGLAELENPKKVDLSLLAEIKDPATQSELLGAALDSEVLDPAAAKQVLAWQGLDLDAKVVVAAHLLEKKQFNDVKMLKLAADTDKWPRKAMAGLLLVQLGDVEGAKILDNLNKTTDPAKDSIRALVLQTAFRFKYERVAPWAAVIAVEPGVGEKLGLLALRTAVRFGDKASLGVMKQQYVSATDAADQMRLALSLLNLSPWLPVDAFTPMVASGDPLIKQIGLAGQAVAEKRGVVDQLSKLIAMNHPIASAWARGYALFHAEPAEAVMIYKAIIKAYDGPDRNRAQRLDEANGATQELFEKDAAAATPFLSNILADEKTPAPLLQAILVGLIRVNGGNPVAALPARKDMGDNNASALRLLLLAKNGQSLDEQQLKDFGILVRGGGALPEALRIQAAWAYLKLTKQTKPALAKLK